MIDLFSRVEGTSLSLSSMNNNQQNGILAFITISLEYQVCKAGAVNNFSKKDHPGYSLLGFDDNSRISGLTIVEVKDCILLEALSTLIFFVKLSLP